MAVVARTLGKISGIAASVLAVVPGGQVFAAAFAANALIMGAIGGKARPTAQGAVTDIQIGANMPSMELLGQAYSGGSRVQQVAYGTENDVPNAHLQVVDIYSGGGPLHGLVKIFGDFTEIAFDGGGAAIGYFSNDTLYRDYQLGATNEADALAPHWSGAPDWGSAYKLSGKAAICFSARFPKDGKRFGSGFIQTGAEWQGVLAYDPRLDTTYPGGSGAERWADPADKAAFAAAKPTWAWTRNPGLLALRYALGTWERDESNSSAEYQKVFGIGGKIDQIVVEDFVELANVCDANGWTVNGTIFEGQGISKWDNLRRILIAGGAQPCFKGARLGLKINAPRVPIATITLDDIGEGEPVSPGTVAYEERKNTLTPYYISPDHKWASVPSTPVQITDFVTEDGEVKPEDVPFDLVTNADQAAQLTGYELVDRREPVFSLPLLRRFPAGALLAFDDAVRERFGIRREEATMTKRSTDWNAMRWSGEFIGERPGKHEFALALTGTSPPVPSLPTPEDRDTTASADPAATSATIRGGYIRVEGVLLTASDAGSSATITVSAHSWDYPGENADVARAGGAITGLSYSTAYHVYFDDSTLAAAAPTYHTATNQADALNSTAHPYRHYLGSVTTPASGGGPVDGGGGGGGYCVVPETPILMADQTERAASTLMVGEWVWTRHAETLAWGSYPITAVKRVNGARRFSAEIGGRVLRGSFDHPVWIDGAWVTLEQIGTPIEDGEVIAITVADAHSFIAAGVLSHNKQVDPEL